MESWGGLPAISLEQVGELLGAVEAQGLGELQRQLQELQEQQRASY
jgi:hypothetical protein